VELPTHHGFALRGFGATPVRSTVENQRLGNPTNEKRWFVHGKIIYQWLLYVKFINDFPMNKWLFIKSSINHGTIYKPMWGPPVMLDCL